MVIHCGIPETTKDWKQTTFPSKGTHFLYAYSRILVAIRNSKESLYALSQSTWAAITKCHRLDGLNNRHLFLTVLEAAKSKIKVPVDSVLGESPFPGLQTAIFQLYPHKVENESDLWSFCFLLGHYPLWKLHPHNLI